MIGLAVYLNRKRLTMAGAEDLCVLSAGITAPWAIWALRQRQFTRNAAWTSICPSEG